MTPHQESTVTRSQKDYAVFYRLGLLIYRRRWIFIAVWAVLLVVALPFVPRVTEPLKIGGFADPSLESSKAASTLARDLGYSTSTVVILFQSGNSGLSVTDPAFLVQTQAALAGLKNLPIRTTVVAHTANPRQVSKDGKTAYEVVLLDADAEAAAKLMPQIKSALTPPSSLVMKVGGGPAYYADVERVSQQDLARAELVAFPVAVIALLFVFGSVIAAGLPVAVGGAGVVVILATIYALGRMMDLSIFTVNLATLLGLGLGLDYSLFLSSRFREEISHGRDPEHAVAVTLATAGKAVTFSGLTVLIGLCALLTFRINLLFSIGIGGIVVVIVSVLSACTLLPAILSLVGRRINAFSVSDLIARLRHRAPRRDEDGFWHRLALFVMRRPILVALPTLAFLLLLGTPFLRVQFSSPDATILPTSVESRQVADTLQQSFNESETTPILLAVRTANNTSVFAPDNVAYLYAFTHELAADPRVLRADSITSLDPRLTLAQYQTYYLDPTLVQDPYITQFVKQFVNKDLTLVSIVTKENANAASSRALVEKIRHSQIGNGITFQVTGATAGVLDVVDGLYASFPLAALFIVLTTYTVLLILFRSIVLPLKAILMNALSIIASYGALVWVFQEGHLSGPLHFTALRFIEPTLPIIMFCTLFGLSMDYEVFLLSRIKEHYELTNDNTASVAVGIERSARIITSAALIVVLVSSSFVTADIVLVKALGLGVAVAVAVDATIVRALLVPATMRLLGHWNWYCPAWLARILPETHLEAENFVPPAELQPLIEREQTASGRR